MFTLTNETLVTLSVGVMGLVVPVNDTESENTLFSGANSSFAGPFSPLSDPNVSHTGVWALVRYLADAISEQRRQARAQGLSLNRFGATVAYCFSFYGLVTFFISLVLNRTLAIASSASIGRPLATSRNRYLSILRRMPISQDVMLKLLRFSAVILLLCSVTDVLVVLNIMAHNFDPDSLSSLTKLVPNAFQYDPVAYADDPYMKMPANEVRFGPTSDMLWPLYFSVAYSVFVETFASAICNKQPLQGAGITLFELSLAIQEMSTEYAFLGGASLANRPTEPLLLICLFSLMEQISNQVGDMLYANKYRLVPSSLLNVFFLWYFVSHMKNGTVFSFPGEIVLTYFGLVLTIVITLVCLLIFVLALVTKGSRLDELNYASFFDSGHEDYEFFSKHLNLNWSQDFYTAALNLGMIAVTSAGKSSYITEYSILAGPTDTWLEKGAWNRLSKLLDSSSLLKESRDSQNAKLAVYLRQNGISGYGNVTTTPTLSMINGGDDHAVPKAEPSFRVRFLYMKETLIRFVQMMVWPLIRVLKWFQLRQSPESNEVAMRNAQTPPFLRHLAEQPQESDMLDLNNVDDEELEENYALLLSGNDFLEDDESPDYVVEEADSGVETDVESDVELLDLTDSTTTGFSLNELMTTDNLVELVQEKDVLEKHLTYEKGMMTRSLFQTLSGHTKAQDDFQKLLSLVVEKRQKEAQDEKSSHTLDDDNPRFDHLACVVCQIEPREIITWPCKCFSICESCRLSLVAKGLEGCVCCRRDVEGVSRVFLP